MLKNNDLLKIIWQIKKILRNFQAFPFFVSHKMANQGINLPSSYGGLMHYNEEYKSRFMIKPAYVIVFLIFILALVAILKIFYPIAA